MRQVDHYRLVKSAAHQVTALLPSFVDIDDVIQEGMIGLLDAKAKFDDSLGVPFEPYAFTRIRGAMLDYLRKNDWMSRSTRAKQKLVDKTIIRLEHKLCRHPKDSEVAQELDITLHAYQALSAQVHKTLSSIEDLAIDNSNEPFLDHHIVTTDDDPYVILNRYEDQLTLIEMIRKLPLQVQHILQLLYIHDFTSQAVADQLKLTPSRISQLHKQALTKLRASLTCT